VARFDDRVVVVTGAASGFGQAMARRSGLDAYPEEVRKLRSIQ
jgi:NADP-dependent 3-hydroxy acid dehydrogenase YdfG